MAEADLGKLIIEQKARKYDLIVPSTAMLTFDAKLIEVPGEKPGTTATAVLPTVNFTHNGHGAVQASLTDHAFRQIMSWADIPLKYVQRLKTPKHAELLNENVQHWLNDVGAKRMLRLFEATEGEGAILRAFLSDKYRRFDNFDLAEQIMPLIRANGWVIKSCSITDTRLYLQVIDPKMEETIVQAGKGGHEFHRICYAGVVISNSEVGAGRLMIEPMVFDSFCTNGAIIGTGLQRSHVGRGYGGGDEIENIEEMLSDETKKMDDAAFWMKVKDVTLASFDQAKFGAAIKKFQGATEIVLPLGPTEIIDVTTEKAGLSESERDIAFKHLFAGGDTSLFGVANAITRTAEDVKNYDRAIELERTGFSILDWNVDDIVKSAEQIANRKK